MSHQARLDCRLGTAIIKPVSGTSGHDVNTWENVKQLSWNTPGTFVKSGSGLLQTPKRYKQGKLNNNLEVKCVLKCPIDLLVAIVYPSLVGVLQGIAADTPARLPPWLKSTHNRCLKSTHFQQNTMGTVLDTSRYQCPDMKEKQVNSPHTARTSSNTLSFYWFSAVFSKQNPTRTTCALSDEDIHC